MKIKSKKLLSIIMTLAICFTNIPAVFAAGIVTSIDIEGSALVTIPASGTNTFNYSATVLDDEGAVMGEETVTWSIEEGSLTGISINPLTGELTIDNTAVDTSLTLKATSNSASINNTLPISIQNAVVTTVTISGENTNVIRNQTGSQTLTPYTIVVKDQSEQVMTGQSANWSINDLEGVSIDASGSVTVEGEDVSFAVGTAHISADVGSVSSNVLNLDVSYTQIPTSMDIITPDGLGDTVMNKVGRFSSIYTTAIKDQHNVTIIGEPITWSVTGDSNVTVPDTSIGKIQIGTDVVANSVTLTATSGSFSQDIVITIENPEVTTVNITGQDTVLIPTNEQNAIKTYTAQAVDQEDDIMSGTFTYSIQGGAPTGVSIDPTTGELTVTQTASVGSITIEAIETISGLAGTKTVSLAETPIYTVTFTVEDSMATPINDAIITFGGVVNPAGNYVFNGAVAGTYEYTVEKTGYDTITVKDFVIDNNKTINIVMSATASNTVTSVEIVGNANAQINLVGDNTSTYTAVVKDQNGDAMPTETVTWSLESPYEGVSINATTGEVTIANTTLEGSVNIVATSDTDALVKVTKAITLQKEIQAPTSVEITGDANVQINLVGDNTSTYTAVVKDQNGDVIPTETVTWSLESPYEGVSINATTGEITIANTTLEGSVNIVVTSDTDALVKTTKTITLQKEIQVPTSMRINGDFVINNNTIAIDTDVFGSVLKTYTIDVLDQNSNPIIGSVGTLVLKEVVDGIQVIPTETPNQYDFVANGIMDDTSVILVATSNNNPLVKYELTVNITAKFQFEIATLFQGTLTPNTMIYASSDITSAINDAKDVVMVVGLYKETDLVGVATISKNMAGMSNEKMKAGFMLPTDITGYKVKAFIWEGTDINDASAVLSDVVELN